MGKDIYKKLITGIFIFILISPYIGWLIGVDIKLEEKRSLAEMPELSIEGIKDQKYFSSVEQYFNDHFSYRGMLIKLKNWIDYYVFHTSPSPKVHIGKDGWLYYFRTEHEYFRIDDCIPGERKRMLNLARELHYRERIVEASGRRFILIIVPDKTTIYPEYFGVERPDVRCYKNRYDLLLTYMKKYPVKNFVRLDNILVAAKKRQQVYYKTDTHWNYYGAMLASMAVLKHLAGKEWMAYFPRMEMRTKPYAGDLSKMIALDIKEQAGFIKKTIYNGEVKTINFGRYMNGGRYRFVTKAYNGKKLLPFAILFRDSFSTRMLPYLKGSFKRLDVIWSNNVTTHLRPEPSEDLTNADIVIVEIAEMYLPGFSVDLKKWLAWAKVNRKYQR